MPYIPKTFPCHFPLLINPRQLRQLLMFHGWVEGGAVEVDEHGEATLLVPEFDGESVSDGEL